MPFAFLINQPSNQPSNQQFSEKYKDSDFQNYSIVDLAYSNNSTGGVILNDGENNHLYMWGWNDSSQWDYHSLIPNQPKPNNYYIPIEIDLNLDNDNNLETTKGTITNIEIGYDHAGAVVNYDGSDHLYMWGSNITGQLGIGMARSQFNSPQEVKGLVEGTIVNFALGGSSPNAAKSDTMIVIDDGESDHLYMWGNNFGGKLGIGIDYDDDFYADDSTKIFWTPQEVDLNFDNNDNTTETVVDIASSNTVSGAIINTDGTDNLYMWGSNIQHQLGKVKPSTSSIPQKVEFPDEIDDGMMTNLSIGDITAGVVIDNELWMWGSNYYSGIGNGEDWNSNRYQDIPVKIIFDIKDSWKVTDLMISSTISLAVVNDGDDDHLYQWGNVREGTDEIIYNDHYNKPNEVDLNFDGDDNIETTQGSIVKLAGGNSSNAVTENFAVVINDGKNDHLYTWGNNKYGGNGNGIGVNGHPYMKTPIEITSGISSSSIESIVTKTSVEINWDLEQNSAVDLISLTLYTNDFNGYNDTNEIDLLKLNNSWGAGSITIENLEYAVDYKDWQIRYETNFGSGSMTIDDFSPGLEQVEGDITIDKPIFTPNTDAINIDAKFHINIDELGGTTKLKSELTISINGQENQIIKIDQDNNFTIKALDYDTEYNLIVEYWLVTDTNPTSPSTTTIEFTTPKEKIVGDITLIKEDILILDKATTVYFTINNSELKGSTKIKDNTIVISGDNFTSQDAIVNDNMTFFLEDLEFGRYYNLSMEYTLVTNTNSIGSTKTINIPEFNIFDSSAPLKPDDLVVKSTTFDGGEISWTENILNSNDNDEELKYHIIVYDSKNNIVKEYKDVTGTSYLITGLKNNSNYTIKVWTVGSISESNWNSEVSLDTNDKYPWIMPVNYVLLILSILFIIFGTSLLIYLGINLKKRK